MLCFKGRRTHVPTQLTNLHIRLHLNITYPGLLLVQPWHPVLDCSTLDGTHNVITLK